MYRDTPGWKPRYNNTDRIKPWEPPGLIQNKIAKNILLGLGITAGAVLFALSPYGLHYLVKGALKQAFYKKDFDREIKRLKKKNFVSLTKTPEGWFVRLTKKGRRGLSKYKLQEIQFPSKKPWDRKWRLYIFDIPEKYRSGRDLLREKLKELGMFNMQRSVLVYPFDCREQLTFIADYYGLSEYSTYVETNFMDIDKELRKYFKRRKILV